MSAKHFIDNPTHLVDTSLLSLTYTNPSLILDPSNKIIYRRHDDNHPQVSIISGGGSGHEPAFGGYVGAGILSAAVAGTLFASPSAEHIRVAVMSRVNQQKGVLVIVMNYTGDVLNFGLAVEKAKAAGTKIDMVVVGDDVGVGKKKAGKVGRRGIAGTCLVVKIAGALAAHGESLENVAQVARVTAKNIVSVGASLSHVHVPGRATLDPQNCEALGSDEVEIGMGIHNEPGYGRIAANLPKLISSMLKQLLDQQDEDRAFLRIDSDEVVLLVNNLGGVSVLEMGGITAGVVGQLQKTYNIKPCRVLCDTYMTSLNGLGFSISILKLENTDFGGHSMLQLLDESSEATGWKAPIATRSWDLQSNPMRSDPIASSEQISGSGLEMDPDSAQKALMSALNRVILAEPEVTQYDTVIGDGDCGIGLKRGAEAVMKLLQEKQMSGDVVIDVSNILKIVEHSMDGTSGALYAIFLNALVHALRQESKSAQATAHVWACTLDQAKDALSKYTPAREGDRTLIDALHPFIEVLKGTGDLVKASMASRKGAERTKGMQASLGRSVYVGGSGFEQVPDPGAWGLSEFFLGLAGVP